MLGHFVDWHVGQGKKTAHFEVLRFLSKASACTKYLMVSFLVVFALTMLIQFCSYFLESPSLLLGEEKKRDELQNRDILPA